MFAKSNQTISSGRGLKFFVVLWLASKYHTNQSTFALFIWLNTYLNKDLENFHNYLNIVEYKFN